MKRLDFINKRLREKNEARTYINNVDEAILQHYRVFAKQTKPLPPQPLISGELLFVAVGTGIAKYALYK